jgi:serine/threonine-protein kinase RsbW/stage II sporulation protein AB (anti-sigma F factor)
VPVARNAIAEYAAAAGADERTLDAIRLAVSEAITNAVIHAYAGRTGDVHVTAAVTGEELWVLVADSGCGHQVASRRPGLGWGLPLIAEASDYFVIAERAAGGTEVRMRFRLDGRRRSLPSRV